MTVSRELTIQYGSTIIGGISTEYLLDGFYRSVLADGRSDSYVEFGVVVVADTSEAFVGRCEALERAFRTPRQDLVVMQNGAAGVRASHSAAVGGFNTDPEIRKVGSVGDTARSRRYEVRVRYQTPADANASPSGLRESSVNVEYDASRIRTVTLSGVFTATSGSTARARYEAAIASHAASALSSLGVTTSELVGEPVTDHDYDNKVLRFSRSYREIIFGQGTDSASNDAAIVDQTINISRQEIGTDRSVATGSGPALRVQELSVYDLHYEASIDKTVTTSLASKYASLRPWLLGQFRTLFNGGAFAVTYERPTYDRARNRIMVDISAEGPSVGQSYVRRTVTISDKIIEPRIFRGVWTGDPLAHFVYQAFATVTRTITETIRFIGTVTSVGASARAEGLAGEFSYPPHKYQQGAWYTTDIGGEPTPVRIGLEDGEYLDMTDATCVVTMRRVLPVSGGTRTSEGGRPPGAVTPGPAPAPTTPGTGPTLGATVGLP